MTGMIMVVVLVVVAEVGASLVGIATISGDEAKEDSACV